MTTWTARLSKGRILCGWTVGGRATCPGLIALIEEDIFGHHIAFQPFYHQARPIHPDEVLPLVIGRHEARNLGSGRSPVGRRLLTATDGTPVVVWNRYQLPAEAPCPRCGRLNLVARMDIRPPSR